MLNEFLSWWSRQLLSLAPARLGSEDRQGGAALFAHARPGDRAAGLDLLLRRRGQEIALGRFGIDEAGLRGMRAALAGRPRAAAVVLRLPAGQVLEQSVALPLAAERDPERVLHYELDRLTPFAPDEVYWGWTVARRDRVRGKLHLSLSVVPKAGLLPQVAALEAAGAAPTAVEGPGADGLPRRIALQRARSGRECWRRRGLAAAATACAVLAVVAAGLPFVRQSAALDAVETRIAALRPAVDQADALRREIAAAAGSNDVIAAERARVGDALGVVATVTNVLPDDTYLTDLQLQGRVLTITGQSAAATRLIALLAAEPAFRNPAFTAPVTRNEPSRAEGFAIRAEVGP